MDRFNISEVDIHLHGRVDYQGPPILMRNLRHSYVLGKEYAWMHMHLIKSWFMKEKLDKLKLLIEKKKLQYQKPTTLFFFKKVIVWISVSFRKVVFWFFFQSGFF